MKRTGAGDAPSERSLRWARILLIAAGLLAVWSILALITGGVRYDLGPVRLSSRNPVRPVLLAMLLAVIAWRMAYEQRLERRLQRLSAVESRAAPIVALIAAASVLAMGLQFGVRAAGGADPLGYVSESALWRQGTLRIDQSFALTMSWPHPEETFAPLGYRLSPDVHVMVPTYAAGLPLLMAAARSVSSCAPYYIGPICGALLVVVTYLLGRRFFNPAAGLVAAVLTAASPTVLYMAMFPMADVPAATFWTAALLVAGPSPGRAAAAGLLTGVAVAIRPNLVPLAVFPWLLSILHGRGLRAAVPWTAAFAAGVAPFVVLVA
jgi:hypothetical protein